MGLLALLTLLVDTLAIYVLHKKEHYFKAKYEVVNVDETANVSAAPRPAARKDKTQ